MPRRTFRIPTLTGGVSQQPPATRLPTQCEESVNAIASITEGLKKRAPTEHLTRLSACPTGSTIKHHTVDLSATERYHVAVQDEFLRVWDILDTADPSADITVLDNTGSPANAADFAYLDSANPVEDIQLLTVADYTLILNKSIKPAMKVTKTAKRNPTALVYARQGNYSTRYVLTLKVGATSTTVTYETDAADGQPPGGGTKDLRRAEESIRTENVVLGMKDALENSTISPAYSKNVSRVGPIITSALTPTVVDSTLVIESLDTTDFEVRVEDSVGSTLLTKVKDSVALFSELPMTAPDGMVVQVDGDPEDQFEGYYVKFSTDHGETTAQGKWSETVAEDVEYQIDETTMPHALIRQADGNFRFTPLDGHTYTISSVNYLVPKWGERSVGDASINADPSFVGSGVQSMFFWKNRLGLLSPDAVSLSEVGEFFNFFRTSTLDVLDGDRIDLTDSDNKATDLIHAAPMAEQLVLFSRRSQFVVRAAGPLTPTSVSIGLASNYDAADVGRPLVVGEALMAPASRGDYSVIQEMRDISPEGRPVLRALDLNAATPSYLKGSVRHLTASMADSLMAVQTDQDEETIYIYSWFFNGPERVQSAWQKFTLGGTNATIKHIEFLDSWLHLVVEREDTEANKEVCLERIDMAPNATDSGVGGKILLDRRVSEADAGITVAAVGGDDQITLPYALSAGITMMLVGTNGDQYPVTAGPGLNQVTVTGGIKPASYWVGELFDMVHTLSEPVYQDRSGAPEAISPVRLKMGNLIYRESSYFDVKVTPKFGDTRKSSFSGLSPSYSSVDALTVRSGRHRFGVMGKAQDVTITLENPTPFPCKFVSCDLEGTFLARG